MPANLVFDALAQPAQSLCVFLITILCPHGGDRTKSPSKWGQTTSNRQLLKLIYYTISGKVIPCLRKYSKINPRTITELWTHLKSYDIKFVNKTIDPQTFPILYTYACSFVLLFQQPSMWSALCAYMCTCAGVVILYYS